MFKKRPYTFRSYADNSTPIIVAIIHLRTDWGAKAAARTLHKEKGVYIYVELSDGEYYTYPEKML